METKVCTKCKVEKNLDEYYFRKPRQNYSARCKKCWVADVKVYNKTDKFKKYQNEYKRKKGLTPQQKIINNLRNRVYKMLFEKIESQSTLELIGCSREDFIDYVEKQFDKNMNWDNYGTYWELDHIKPLSKGGSFHYSNCQPLSVTENRKKSNTYG